MNQDQVSGTPPQLWGHDRHGKKLWTGTTMGDQVRIKRLCRQVEKLSWIVEYMDSECEDERYHSRLPTIEGAEKAWQNR